ncbi:MAG TPA: kelch repeat-containing protein [Candidatus Eisenbacteria bacterium]|nr:kelch repeat-containing protein [Candidatus Eisenbacteria bacterium]
MLLWLQRTSAALLAAALLVVSGEAEAALSIPSNTWVKQPTPSQVGLSGFSGQFQARGWNRMMYDPLGKRTILFDGYMDASRPYTIYANALWTYDVLANRLSLEKVNNWARLNGITTPLPANTTDPTPFDRHSYACIAFVPEKNEVVMWGGANSSISNDYIGDTWIYSFATRAWREVTAATHPFNVFEQTATYDPNTHRFVVFGGATSSYGSGTSAWLFDVNSELWEQASTPSTPPARMSQSMVYDSMRRVSYVFGGGTVYPNPGNEMWTFDASARVWSQVSPQNSPPSVRRFAAMAYDTKHDLVMLWGGTNNTTALTDTWIYRPSTRQWQQLFPPASPPNLDMSNEDLIYDPDNDVFMLHMNGDFWLYRYASSSDAIAPGDVSDLRIR